DQSCSTARPLGTCGLGRYFMRALSLSLALALITARSATAGDVTTQPTLTLEGAKRVVAAAIAYARSHDAPGAAIAVVDAGGHTICLERLGGPRALGVHSPLAKRLRDAPAVLARLSVVGMLGGALSTAHATPAAREAAATVDLTTEAGAQLTKATWRYSDARIVETSFRAPDAHGQPAGAPIRTNDI